MRARIGKKRPGTGGVASPLRLKGGRFGPEKSRRLYLKARKMLAGTRLDYKKIAERLGVSPSFVSKADRGRPGDKPIRQSLERHEIRYGLKRIKLFSPKQKAEHIGGIEPYLWRLLRGRGIEFHDREDIVANVKLKLFSIMDYFDPKEKIPLDYFLKRWGKQYISNEMHFLFNKKKLVRFGAIERELDTLTMRRLGKEKPEANADYEPALEELLKISGNLVTKRGKEILRKTAAGLEPKQIAEQLGISSQLVYLLKSKSIKALNERFGKENSNQ